MEKREDLKKRLKALTDQFATLIVDIIKASNLKNDADEDTILDLMEGYEYFVGVCHDLGLVTLDPEFDDVNRKLNDLAWKTR